MPLPPTSLLLLLAHSLKLHDVEEALLKSLSRLDELGALVEVTRGDTERLKRDVLPLLNERANELRKLFILVERLRV